jgi:hypothetical protein
MRAEIDTRIHAINVNVNQKIINEPGSQHND